MDRILKWDGLHRSEEFENLIKQLKGLWDDYKEASLWQEVLQNRVQSIYKDIALCNFEISDFLFEKDSIDID